jgi:hypothetical protein
LASSVDNLIHFNDEHGKTTQVGHKVIHTQMALFEHGLDRLQGSINDDFKASEKKFFG